MTLRAIIRHKNMRAALGGALVALLGWQLCWLPLGQSLAHFSYDLPFVFTEPGAPAKVVLVELDEVSYTELRQTYGQTWDRRLHAQLLDHLRADGASLVVFDVTFTDPGPDAAADLELARAIRAQGRVVLAADMDRSRRNGIVGERIFPPNDVLRAATSNWGPTQAEVEDGVVRKIFRGSEQKPALAWVAASLADASALRTNGDHFAERWVRYYGPGGTLPHVSYSQATHQPAGFYRGKTVFIGGRPKTRFVAEEVDEFLTPWRLHGQPQISGLELTATEFLNLSRGEFLRRLPVGGEFTLLALLGILAGAGLACARPGRAVFLAAAGVFVVVVLAFILFFQRQPLVELGRGGVGANSLRAHLVAGLALAAIEKRKGLAGNAAAGFVGRFGGGKKQFACSGGSRDNGGCSRHPRSRDAATRRARRLWGRVARARCSRQFPRGQNHPAHGV